MQLATITTTPHALPRPGVPELLPQAPRRSSRDALELARAAAMLPADDQTVVPSVGAPEEVRSGFVRYARWAKTLRSIPGINMSGWRSSRPDDIQVWTLGPGWTTLLKAITDGDVEGAHLDVRERGDDGSGALDFYRQTQFQINAVSAMPGVIDWMFDGAAVPGDPATILRFTVSSADRAEQLADFVPPRIPGMRVQFAPA